jgi:hypothetical protein
MSDHPSAVDGLDVNEVKDGLVVYDPAQDRVHYLNATAAVVFTLCDGTQDTAAIADVVAKTYNLDEAPVADVEACVLQLADEGLLQ